MKKYLFLCFYLFIAALNFNIFICPNQLVTGGTQGIALIIKSIISIKPSLIIFIINSIALFISFLFLNHSITKSALLSSFIYPLFIRLTSNIHLSLPIPLIFITIISSIIYGLTTSNIYNLKFSNGGITIINLLLQKYLHIKLSISTFIINTIIIIIGSITIGLSHTIYSVLFIFFGSITINHTLKNNKKDCLD